MGSNLYPDSNKAEMQLKVVPKTITGYTNAIDMNAIDYIPASVIFCGTDLAPDDSAVNEDI